MANDLVVAEKIEKRLMKPSNPKVFPLAAMHRKELRILKKKNIGELKEQLKNIKVLKKDEYKKKYCKQIEKEISSKVKIADKLNADWLKRIVAINQIIQERIDLEKQSDISNFHVTYGYHISNLEKQNPESDARRIMGFNIENRAEVIAGEEFDKKFGKKFQDVAKAIENMITQYEEAINFGDLDIVKELYYVMKGSDAFFKKVSEINV